MSNLNGECTCQFPFFAKKKVGRGEVQDKKVACRPNNGIQHDHLARSRSLSLSLSLSHRVVDRTSAQNVRQLFILFDRPVLHSTRLHYFTKAKLHVK